MTAPSDAPSDSGGPTLKRPLPGGGSGGAAANGRAGDETSAREQLSNGHKKARLGPANSLPTPSTLARSAAPATPGTPTPRAGTSRNGGGSGRGGIGSRATAPRPPASRSISKVPAATPTTTMSSSSLCADAAADAQQLQRSAQLLPDVPLLYHTALAAHHAAAAHYQQAFVPLGCKLSEEPIVLYGGGGGSGSGSGRNGKVRSTPYTHDPSAGHTALRLLILALDLLSMCLSHRGLSDRERAAFGLEFVTVGLKLAHAAALVRQMRPPQRAAYGIEVDTKRLNADLESVGTKSLAISKRSPHLKTYAHGLQLAVIRLAIMRDRGSQARLMIKQALATTPDDESVARYSLHLRLMGYLRETSNPEFFKAADDLEAEAQASGHTQLVLVVHIARLAAHFDLRKWDNLGDAIEAAARMLGLEETGVPECGMAEPLRALLVLHYCHFKALYASRTANERATKAALKVLYNCMDDAMDQGTFHRLRANGGVLKIRLPSASGRTQYLHVQTTPINVLYSLTYLNSVVSRRNFFMRSQDCRSLVHANAMLDWDHHARAEDIWDTGFSAMHGVGDSLQLRQTIMTLRVEVMMEKALALICRSSFEEADKLLTACVEILRACNLWKTHLPHVALLYAQFAHYMGRPDAAQRYYRAAMRALVPGSELRILVEIGLLGASGHLSRAALQDYELARRVNDLADMCRSGSNVQLHAVGNFLSCLTDPERIGSKRKLSSAYDVARKSDLNMLYGVVFAFTTAANMYGDREKQFKMLGGGADIAEMLGGHDRADHVGQATLGVWYARKMQDHYRLEGEFKKEAEKEARVAAHVTRLKEIYEYSLKRFPLAESAKE